MKKSIIVILLLSCAIHFVRAQTVEEALKTTLTQFHSAADQNGMIAGSNRFVLIANKWNTDCSTHYYAAYGKSIIGAMEKDNAKKIAYFDEAEKHLEAAKTNLKSENDEVCVLTAMIASMKIGVYPDQWLKYMEIYSSNLQKAKALRAENPRIYYVEGTSKFYTPEAYGGGKKNALPYFQKAAEYFNTENELDIRKPFWGKRQNEEFVKKCGE
jgi:urease alpha subunit